MITIGQTQEKIANMNPRKSDIKVIFKCSFYRLGRGKSTEKVIYSATQTLAKRSGMKQSSKQSEEIKKLWPLMNSWIFL